VKEYKVLTYGFFSIKQAGESMKIKINIEECKVLKKLLDKNKRIHVDIIGENDNAYRAGVMLIPSYISKGLEFDVVIIANHRERYLKNDLDIKLLYVAITRTLHRLLIFAEEGCIEILRGFRINFSMGCKEDKTLNN
jgi:DNA helicase-2/ATP-dependent DNA helicase PcrA